jgi:putative NIF3 family GTP cyclohydrolase 1 type 2
VLHDKDKSEVRVNLAAFAGRLDDLFAVDRFDETGGWNFALSESETADLLRVASPEFAARFNGLLCALNSVRHELNRVYLLVFPELSLVDAVITAQRRRGNPGAVIVTHHPCDMETSGRGFLAIPPHQLDTLIACNTALYVLHAPLDCHPQVSTSGAIADGLGLRRVGTFAPYYAGDAGVIAEQAPEPFGAFAARVQRLCELPRLDPEQIRFAGRPVARIAIVAGGGDDLDDLAQAESHGADTFLAGHWWTPHPGEWSERNRAALRDRLPNLKMNLLGASHDGSELVVFRDRLAPLFAEWELEVRTLRQDDHWR